MKEIIKWIAIAIVAFIVIRLVLGGIFSTVQWLFDIIADAISEINVGMTLLTLLVMGVAAAIYFKRSVNKSYDEIIANAKEKFGDNFQNNGAQKASSNYTKTANINKQKASNQNTKNPTNEKPKPKQQASQKKATTNQSTKNSTSEKSKPKQQASQKKSTTNKTQNNSNNTPKDFESFVVNLSDTSIKEMVNKRYSLLCKSYAEKVGFGDSGAIEFVGSITLTEFKSQFQTKVYEGHHKVFAKEWSPLQFSDYMDEVINSSEIPYAKWSAVYRYLEQNHKWIQQHDCAKEGKRLSPKVESTIHKAFDANLVDLDDIAQLTEYAIGLSKQGEVNEALDRLKFVIENMSRVIISNQSVDVSNLFDRTYYNRLMLELCNSITFYSAISYNVFANQSVERKKYDILSDLVMIGMIAVPRENNFENALDILLQIYVEVNTQRGIAIRKEIEDIKYMPWSLEQALSDVRQLLIQDNILNRLKNT